ncbi:MAG: efflux transporter outer membrane subunit [Akkermansiaceae bacterium]|nr:efflux transporter outer membrane subunit [Akkermansiaceae bacterium]
MKTIQLTSITLCVLLSACKPVGPDYQGPPKVGHAAKFRGGGSRPVSLDKWWRKLGSSELNRLVDQALENNHDIAIAGQRIREARALRKQAASAILPRADASTSYTHTSLSSMPGLDSFGTMAGAGFLDSSLKYWSAGIDVSWEIDVFGGGKRKIRGAKAREQAAQEALHATRLAIAAEVTETYFTIAGMREQLAKVNAQVKLQQSQTNDTKQRLAAGASSRLDFDRARARLAMIQANIPPLEAGIVTQLRRLSLLLGIQPGALDGRRVAARSLPASLPMVRTGLPADLILRRPDVRIAERELAAATEDIGVAVSSFYPRFSIGGGPANVSSSSGNLFNPSDFFWQYSPQVRWSPFTAGSNKAALEAANARQKAAMLRYQKSSLAAIGEVESSLANLHSETRKLAIVQRARAATASAVKRIQSNYEAGATDRIDVLVEEERLREVEITEIRVKSQMMQLWIRLHKSLGGGWN